jgi:hypothetical protein
VHTEVEQLEIAERHWAGLRGPRGADVPT